jgi:1-deoxy-D-xylulose-5-phosphate reductoisomerase
LNAADEIAVEAFLEGRIGFCSIGEIVEETLNRVPGRQARSIDDILEVDRLSRAVARELIARHEGARRAGTMQ